MFTTVDEVKELTDYDVDVALIGRAQAIVESYIGRVEVQIENGYDLMLLGRATAYQAAYMKDNADTVFEQVALIQISQLGQAMTLRQDGATPWVAPLTVLTCQRLSWNRMRSVKTGSIFAAVPGELGWKYE